MPDLGEYAGPVLAAYVFSIAVLVAVVWISFARAARVARELKRIERGGDG